MRAAPCVPFPFSPFCCLSALSQPVVAPVCAACPPTHTTTPSCACWARGLACCVHARPAEPSFGDCGHLLYSLFRHAERSSAGHLSWPGVRRLGRRRLSVVPPRPSVRLGAWGREAEAAVEPFLDLKRGAGLAEARPPVVMPVVRKGRVAKRDGFQGAGVGARGLGCRRARRQSRRPQEKVVEAVHVVARRAQVRAVGLLSVCAQPQRVQQIRRHHADWDVPPRDVLGQLPRVERLRRQKQRFCRPAPRVVAQSWCKGARGGGANGGRVRPWVRPAPNRAQRPRCVPRGEFHGGVRLRAW